MSETEKPSVAVALHYDGEGAPTVTAKGRGAVADRIVEAAEEHGVHIEENPLLAEALSSVELETEIPEALYRAVAEVIGFVLRQSGQLPSRQKG